MRGEDVGKDEGKVCAGYEASACFVARDVSEKLPVPNTSACRTLADSCVLYRKAINVFEQTLVAGRRIT